MSSSVGNPTPGRTEADIDPRVLRFAAEHFGRAIRPATPADLGAMAHIHATSGTPGLLSDLGEAFLRDVYYAGLLASPVGRAQVIEVRGNVAGFATYSADSSRLFGEIFRPRIGSTLLALVRASVRKPRVVFDFLQTVFAVEKDSQGSNIRAEAVSLEVAPAFQGLGLGFLLLQLVVSELRDAGETCIKARILAENRAVERLYPPLGFRKASTFRLHDRDWVLMVLDDAS
jgi:ribosomal protein S18 acetylase RimI-like enzyme